MLPNKKAISEIQENLQSVKRRIVKVATGVGRNPQEINLVAVTKTHGNELIRCALLAGHKIFGENRVQEAENKWLSMQEEFPDKRLHLIGPLQRNKVKRAIQLFDVIETLDRESLAYTIAREIDNSGLQPSCFIQVNTGEEPQKAGVHPLNVDSFIKLCRDELALPVKGLMCIPPHYEEPGLHFGLLAEMARRNNLPHLSMGMSNDFEAGIQFGASYVRVGTAIFGTRKPFKNSDG